MQNPSKVLPRSGQRHATCKRHICSPIGTPKIRNRARGSSRPSQDTGLPQAIPVGRPLWCLGTREVCTVGSPSILGSGPWPEARPSL